MLMRRRISSVTSLDRPAISRTRENGPIGGADKAAPAHAGIVFFIILRSAKALLSSPPKSTAPARAAVPFEPGRDRRPGNRGDGLGGLDLSEVGLADHLVLAQALGGTRQ